MRKFLLSLSLALLSVSAMCQMTAKEVVDRYNKLTGMDKFEISGGGVLIDMEITTPAGAGTMPMQMIKGEKAQFRIEMTMMGQTVLVVTDGVEGWMKIPNQPVQPMPKEALDALASQGDVTSSFKVDSKQFDYKMIDSKGSLYVISATPRKAIKNLNIKEMTLSFDKESGMMVACSTKVEMKGKVIEMNVKMSEQKDFGGILMPSVMVMQGKGIPQSTVIIRDLKFNYPTSASMFAKPE